MGAETFDENEIRQTFYAKYLKRFLDFVLSLIAIIVLSPLLLILTIVGAIVMKGNPFFTQERGGKIDSASGKERIIRLYKFRSMAFLYDENGNLLPDKQRTNKYGKLIRTLSLDELPSLLNILKGDLAIVGPRPLFTKYLSEYSETDRKRHLVRPGLTGLAQANGRNRISWKEKFQYDLQYIRHITFTGDIKIIFLTIKKVFIHSDVYYGADHRSIKEYFEDCRKSEAETKMKEISSDDKIKALVIAGGISQAALIQDLKSRGIYTILADKNPQAYAVPYADKFYPVSTMDVEGIKKLATEEKVNMVITACADQVLEVVAKVSEDLGLPCYIDYQTSVLVSDKQFMKEQFEKSGVPTAKHIVMSAFNAEKIKDFEYPLIVKPVDCYSSRGVRKVQNNEELEAAFQEAIEMSRSRKAIVEEFCEGVELTVDVYVEDGEAHVLTTSISDKIKDKDRFVIYRTKNPAPLTAEISDEIRVIAQRIAAGFNLKNSPMLIQLITDGKRLNVLEFCARTGGCIKYQLIRKASGFDVISAVVDLTLGKKPHVGELHAESKYILNTFLYCAPGKFHHIEGLEELKQDGIITEYAVFAHEGKKLSEVTCSADRVGSFTVQCDDVETLNKLSECAMNRIRVINENGQDILRREWVLPVNYELKEM